MGTSLVAQIVKNPPANAEDLGLIPGLGRSPGRRQGNPLQYSCIGKNQQTSLEDSTGSQESDRTEQLTPSFSAYIKWKIS